MILAVAVVLAVGYAVPVSKSVGGFNSLDCGISVH